jgi:hypothetical protein
LLIASHHCNYLLQTACNIGTEPNRLAFSELGLHDEQTRRDLVGSRRAVDNVYFELR